MIENEVLINGTFRMRINFNLKGIGSQKSQIWLTTTINKERVRIYTGLLIEPEFWIKTTRTQVGERANEDSSLSRVQLNYNKGINKELKKILGYCRLYGVEVSQNHLLNSEIEHNAKNFTNYINCKLRGVEATIRKNPVEFINAYIERKSQMVNKDTQRQIEDLIQFASRNEYQLMGTYEEHISGATKNENRMVLMECINYCIEHQVNYLLLSELSRLGRSTLQVLKSLEILHESGVSVYIQNLGIHTLQPNGEVNPVASIMVTVLAEMANIERSNIVYRLNSGRDSYIKNGGKLGRKPGSVKTSEQKREEYKEVISLLKKGYSVRNVAKLGGVSTSTVQRVKKEFDL